MGTPSGADLADRDNSAQVSTGFRLAWAALVLLGVYTIASVFLPWLDRVSYRLLVFTVVGAALIFLAMAKRAWPAARTLSRDTEAVAARRRSEANLSAILLILLLAFVLLSFSMPALIETVNLKIISLVVVVLALLSNVALESFLRRRQPRSRAALLASGGLMRRIVVSVATLLLLPAYLVASYLVPALDDSLALRLLIMAITVAALLGFWSIRGDLSELRHIMNQARAIAAAGSGARVITQGPGELRELAETFNAVLHELNARAGELDEARHRVESLTRNIGTAISAAGSFDHLIQLVLEVAADSLAADRGILQGFPDKPRNRYEMMTERTPDAPAHSDSDLRFRMVQAAESGAPYVSDHILALPLRQNDRLVGVLGLERNSSAPSFSEEGINLLQDIGAQAAVGIAASYSRIGEEEIIFETIAALALAVEARDPYTRGHSQRVSNYATAIAQRLRLDEESVETVRKAGLLLDIGRVGVPDSVARKAGPLTSAEYDVARQHAVTGEMILRPLPFMHKLLPPIRGHHERYDGKGYPDGLSGESIDIKARILAMADAFDAMLCERPYRRAFTLNEAIEEIRKASGNQFDPNVASALLELIHEGKLGVKMNEGARRDNFLAGAYAMR